MTATASAERIITVASFPSLTDTKPRQRTLAWSELAKHLCTHRERPHKGGYGWSPALYRPDTTRGNENVEAVTALVFDVDHGEPPWALLEALECCAHTTYSHTPEAPRWRVILPLTRPVPAADWPGFWERARFWLCPDTDDSCKDASRFYWLPSCAPGAARDAVHHEGAWLDPDQVPPLPELPELPDPQEAARRPAAASANGVSGGRPGDDFNRRAAWQQILEPAGWRCVYTHGDEGRWRRPGKTGPGISATTNHNGSDLLYVFTSNAPPFEPRASYSKFGAFALLHHDGDYQAAARALAAQGYGEPHRPADPRSHTNGHTRDGRRVDPTTGEILGADDATGDEFDELTGGDASAKGVNSSNSSSDQSPSWPAPLAAEAFHGLAGEVVRTFDPHSEADPAAVLLQFLAAFANAVGPAPHTMVGTTRHGARLFACIVGKTARARKGDSWTPVRELLRRADAEWERTCLATGLSTGEGLIHAVRDPAGDGDGDAPDRRVLAVETEFGRTLRVMGRDGNTLSAILRDGWDGRDLRVMTRGAPLRASGAHICVIGHITLAELRRELGATDGSNGFANRFLWVCARRSKQLPDPQPVAEAALSQLAGRVRRALDEARRPAALARDEPTRAAWNALYGRLTDDREGLAGDVLARAEAHVLRLSMVYALLDGSRLIRPAHLAAAVAVWDYCAAGVQYVFRTASGDAVADDILRHLATAGELSRTDISNRLGRHVRAERLRIALDTLERTGGAVRATVPTDGRPVEVWRATGKTAAAYEPLLPYLNSLLSLISQPDGQADRGTYPHTEHAKYANKVSFSRERERSPHSHHTHSACEISEISEISPAAADDVEAF